jgi:hypothetical protein
MEAARTQLWAAGWSRKRHAAVAAFGLFMLYVHPTQSADDLTASGLTELESTVLERFGSKMLGALEEARNSGLAGLARGPANGYRHLLISGELWRRLGPIIGPIAAAGHELAMTCAVIRALSMLEWISTTTDPALDRQLVPPSARDGPRRIDVQQVMWTIGDRQPPEALWPVGTRPALAQPCPAVLDHRGQP